MNAVSWLLLAIVAVLFVLAFVRLLKGKGGCSCSGGKGCSCSSGCSGCSCGKSCCSPKK